MQSKWGRQKQSWFAIDKIEREIQFACQTTSKTSIKAKSLDLDVCIEKFAPCFSNDGSLKPPEDQAQVSEQNSMFVGLQFQPVYS